MPRRQSPLLVSPHPIRGYVAPGEIPLSYSHRQFQTFRSCRRARWLATEVAPLGWAPGALPLMVEARRCKALTALPLELGKVVHGAAARIALTLKVSDCCVKKGSCSVPTGRIQVLR